MDNHIVIAGNTLTNSIGKYITIYHKWNYDRKNKTAYNDCCVVKLLSVTKPGLLSEPTVTVQFIDGTKAMLRYVSEYRQHLILKWDYNRFGNRFNKYFVCNVSDKWEFTYDESSNLKRDYNLTTGMLLVELYDTDFESQKAAAEYTKYYESAQLNSAC